MKRPVISIITICKNSAKTIVNTIRSILDQPVDGLEYIIIDGGSTDGTQEIIKSFGNRVDVFVSEPDNGISDAFNKGIDRASGEIIGLINSDDALLPDTLQKVIDFFTQNTNIKIVHGDVLFYDGDLFVKRISPPARWWFPWRMGTFNIHAATFVKREVYEKYGDFNTTYNYAMDDDLFLKWLHGGVKIAYFPKPLVKVQAGGVSGRYAFKVFGEKRRALLENGFPRIPADIQYACRFAGQSVVFLQQFIRRIVARRIESSDNGINHGK
jgi:glycosyltransferase involved in cell wall biosynthesis